MNDTRTILEPRIKRMVKKQTCQRSYRRACAEDRALDKKDALDDAVKANREPLTWHEFFSAPLDPFGIQPVMNSELKAIILDASKYDDKAAKKLEEELEKEAANAAKAALVADEKAAKAELVAKEKADKIEKAAAAKAKKADKIEKAAAAKAKKAEEKDEDAAAKDEGADIGDAISASNDAANETRALAASELALAMKAVVSASRQTGVKRAKSASLLKASEPAAKRRKLAKDASMPVASSLHTAENSAMALEHSLEHTLETKRELAKLLKATSEMIDGEIKEETAMLKDVKKTVKDLCTLTGNSLEC